jgi:uncharacterized surface protein with fasciclin (FAS1) repeats
MQSHTMVREGPGRLVRAFFAPFFRCAFNVIESTSNRHPLAYPLAKDGDVATLRRCGRRGFDPFAFGRRQRPKEFWTMRKLLSLAVIAALGVGFAGVQAFSPSLALADHHKEKKEGGYTKADKDIIDIATDPKMEQVTTLVAAIKAAGLVDALKGDGPFTVFAPTNDAFAKLPAGTVEDLLKPENKEKLKGILLYHVHAGAAVKAADVKTMELSTLNGKSLNVKAEGGNVTINDAKVIKTDVVGKNGVIHLIDAVVLP